VKPSFLGVVRYVFGRRLHLRETQENEPEWINIELRGYDVDSLAGESSGFGHRLVIDGLPEVRAALAEIGRSLVAQCGGSAEHPDHRG
jgi:hypothetical protein